MTTTGINLENLQYPSIRLIPPIPRANALTISHVNVRSIWNKILQFQQAVLQENIDICAVTEMWIKHDDKSTIKDVSPVNYKGISYPTSSGKSWGGLALIFTDHIDVQDNKKHYESEIMEAHRFNMKAFASSINLYIIYRYPNSSVLSFCNEITELFEYNVANDRGHTLLLGYFNIHLDDIHNLNTVTFTDLLESLNLQNRVTFPTHIRNHALDLVIDDITSPIIREVKIGHLLADHNFVLAYAEVLRPPLPTKSKQIDHSAFDSDIRSLLHTDQKESLTGKVDHYNNTLKTILNSHAPVQTKQIKKHFHLPWFNDQIRAEIQVCRHKERTWNNNPTEYNFQAFYYQRRYIANIIKAAQRHHFIDLITENKNDFKKIFSTANTLLHRETAMPLPPTDDYHKLANDLNMFFINKIKKIMEALQPLNNIDNGPSDDTSWCTETNFMTNFRLHAFDPVETDYVLQQVKKVAVKSCELDLIPAKVLIKHTSSLAESIKDIINTSLLLGEVSKNLKDVILRLLLKKANLNLVFMNYRPVSNLSYILKMTERAVSDQI